MDWPYIAGFFDGEGCVSVGVNQRPICTMAQTDGPHLILEKIQEFLFVHGIKSSLVSYAPRKNQRPSKTLIITSSNGVEDFLTSVLPHLIVKKEKTEFALTLLSEPNRVKKAREDAVNKAAAEYSQGILSLQQAEAKYGIGRKRMLRKLKELGIRKRHRWENGTWRDVKGKFTLTRHHAGIVKAMPLVLFHVKDIANLLNCHPDTIRLMRAGKTWRHI